MANLSTVTASIFDLSSGTVLVIGYGNPGRMDDGLGPALSVRLEACGFDGVSVETDYQLVVEIAHEIGRHDNVVFVDAAVSGPAPFSFTEVAVPEQQPPFNSHSLSPEAAMYLARNMFGAATKGYLLGIRGYEYDRFEENLSEGAKENLDAAFTFIVKLLGREKRIA